MNIGMDKIAHFGIGGMITAFATLIAVLQEDLGTAALLASPCIGHVCTFILSFIKERVVDDRFEWKDILAAMVGSAVIHLAVIIGVVFGLLSH